MLMKKEVIEDNEKLKEKNEQLQLERDTAIEVAKERKQIIEDIQRKLDIEKLEKLKLEQELREEKQAYNQIYNRLDKAKEKCKYLLENEQVEINERTYIKQTADDIITRYIYESLEGEDKE